MIEDYIRNLKPYIAIKSISTDPQYSSEISKTVDFLKQLFESNQFEVKVIDGYKNPIIIASYTVNKVYPTALVYGHYDVQPAFVEDGWNSDPFKLTLKNNKLYGRGVADNKGQSLIHIISILNLLKEKKLTYNVKFIIEGNEETGSPLIMNFLKDYKNELKGSFILISDGPTIATHPVIEVSLRGLLNTTLTVKTSHTNIHSGEYGGTAPNAIEELSKLISKIYNKNNEITIPGFYKGVKRISKKDRDENKKIPFDIEEHKKISGTKKIFTENSLDYYSQLGMRPCIELTGIVGGYYSQGYMSIIPANATAKLNFRLVEGQDPKYISEIFREFIKKKAPQYLDINIETDKGFVKAVTIDHNNNYIQKAKKLIEKVYNKQCYYYHVGATIPIVKHIQDILEIPQVLLPLCNEDSNMHGIDENFDINYIQKGLEFSNEFFSKR